jgi:hypothetical protein
VAPTVAIWIGIALVVVAAVVVVATLALAGARRVRREARRIEDAILGRTFADPELRGVRVAIGARTPIWGGPVRLEVRGTVATPAQRDAVLSIAREQAARAGRPVRVEDGLRVATPASRGEVA